MRPDKYVVGEELDHLAFGVKDLKRAPCLECS